MPKEASSQLMEMIRRAGMPMDSRSPAASSSAWKMDSRGPGKNWNTRKPTVSITTAYSTLSRMVRIIRLGFLAP